MDTKKRPHLTESSGAASEELNSGLREDHHAALRVLALALARDAGDRRHRVVHDLALERAHRLQPHPLAALQDRLRRRAAELAQLLAAVRAPARDVQHQPAARSRLLLDREPRQLLQRLEDRAAGAYELLEVLAAVDAHDRAAGLDVQVDVAVVVEQIEQPLEVVTGDVALLHEDVVATPRLLL